MLKLKTKGDCQDLELLITAYPSTSTRHQLILLLIIGEVLALHICDILLYSSGDLFVHVEVLS